MVTVGLRGKLARERERLALSQSPMRIRWVDLSRDPREQSAADVILVMKDDQEATAVCDSIEPCIAIRWAAVPPPDEVDVALQEALFDVYGFVVGYTDAMHDVCRWVRVLAHPVARGLDVRGLILGATGVGKELVARAIHRIGPRRHRPFLALNCAAIPTPLAPSELFGHVRGAFTGAVTSREGAFQAAGDGVLFLDEIAHLSLEVQGQLLRALEDRVFSPVGSNTVLKLHAQVLTATNQPPAPLLERGTFRADLYFRLAQITVLVPSLEERMSDLTLLVHHFWQEADGGPFDPRWVEELRIRSWPGNVRQLRTVVERAVLLQATGHHAPLARALDAAGGVAMDRPAAIGKLADLRTAFDRQVLEAVLRRTGGDTEQAARELGVTRRTVYNLVRRHGLNLLSGS